MRLYGLTKKHAYMLVLLLGLTFFSCGQDSIFYDISIEPEPKTPIIPGSPTAMVIVKNQLFIGSRMSRTIHRYADNNGEPAWSVFAPPGGSLGDLATDGNYLYALVFPDGEPLNSSVIKRYDFSTETWDKELSAPGFSIQTIFGAGGYLFIGSRLLSNYQSFAVMYHDPSGSVINLAIDQTSLLKGAVRSSSGYIYLATEGSGIFRFNNGVINGPLNGTSKASVVGIIETGGVVLAVCSNGSILTENQGEFTSFSAGVNFTGALNFWNDPANQFRPTLLLMGIRGRGTSLNHGYREMVLNNGRPSAVINEPGRESPTSSKNRAKYTAGIGVHPVEDILQVPDKNQGGPLDYRAYSGIADWEPPIFAATAKNGLWAYHNGEWNAEN
jgi:hypothetical protein